MLIDLSLFAAPKGDARQIVLFGRSSMMMPATSDLVLQIWSQLLNFQSLFVSEKVRLIFSKRNVNQFFWYS